MEQELDNAQTFKEIKEALHSESSNESNFLNLNCDSNFMFDTDEDSLSCSQKETAGDDKSSNKKYVDFANIGKLLTGKTGASDTSTLDDRVASGGIEEDNGDSKEDKAKDEMIGEQQGKVSKGLCNNVRIMTIEVPDDEDLFDNLKREPEIEMGETKSEGNLEKSELYKYLTEQDLAQLWSQEVTPCQSRHDSGESDSSEASDGYTSASSEEETPVKHVENLDSSSSHQGEETPLKSQTPVGRRKPGRKPGVKKTIAKKAAKAAGLSAKTIDKLEKSKQVTEKWIKDLAIPENLSLTQKVKLNILELNQYLTCGLCKGYLYEASTVTECMHTFCKNCIVRHCMEVSLHCPVCSILIHPTDPFVNIRLDRMIQDIVYKLLPNVAETEMERIKAFYAEHPEMEQREVKAQPEKAKVSPKDKELKDNTPSQMVSLMLETEGEDAKSLGLEKRFIRVTSRATIANVCTFLKRKLELEDQSEVELFCCGDAVEDDSCTLENIKTKFFGEQDCLMLMQYKVRES